MFLIMDPLALRLHSERKQAELVPGPPAASRRIGEQVETPAYFSQPELQLRVAGDCR